MSRVCSGHVAIISSNFWPEPTGIGQTVTEFAEFLGSKGVLPQLALKRFFDFVVSLVGLVALVPHFAAIATAIRLGSHGPICFRQLRVGVGGHPLLDLQVSDHSSGCRGPEGPA